MRRVLCLFLSWPLVLGLLHAREPNWERLAQQVAPLLEKGTLVISQGGQPVFQFHHQAKPLWIPASTLKIATALYALELWGASFRYTTEIYLRDQRDLLIRGLGDPFLVSEELQQLGRDLQKLSLPPLRHLLLDNSAFAYPLLANGVERSNNPYDALNGALLTNFNTVHLEKKTDGTLVSGEPQTPITPLSLQQGQQLPVGKHRLNLARDPQQAQQYVGELMQAIWEPMGIRFSGKIRVAERSSSDTLLRRFENSRSLEEVIQGMLRYSNNFIANQLLLAAALEQDPTLIKIDFSKATEFWKAWWEKRFGELGQSLQVVEASGISKQNQLSPSLMLALLDQFRPYSELLPTVEGLRAKTGTLRGIYTLAGYAGPENEWEFILFLEQNRNSRNEIAALIREATQAF